MPMNPRLLRPTQGGFASPDADARAYLAAVRIADGANLEPAVAKAISDFIIGCKADGIFGAIKAACILMGARTLSGALTPLVGSAPTNNGPFVSGDYNRETGLLGDGVGKYLDSNRNNNAGPQDSFHMCVYAPVTLDTANKSQAGAGAGGNGATQIAGNATTYGYRVRSSTNSLSAGNYVAGFLGVGRSTSASHDGRANQTDFSGSVTSQTPHNGNLLVYCRGDSSNVAGAFAASRIAFYSIGEALTLSTLENRVVTLYNAIGAAI
jgi:hypothetical protein